MADTTESAFPEILDIRFVAVNVKIAEIREVLALHTARFSKIEARLTELGNRDEARRLTSGMIGHGREARCNLERLPPPPAH